MFVKVMRGGHETLYECRSVAQRPTERERYLTLTLEPGPPGGLIIDKADTKLYLMNEGGETIDRLSWSGFEEDDPSQDEPCVPTISCNRLRLLRYSAGTDEDGWIGWYEPADKSWIMFIDKDHKALYFGSRDPETGAILVD